MSVASRVSCCSPCAAAPVVPQQPTTTGSGPPAKGEVTGGGAPAPGATFDSAPEPIACGQWVPAPVVVGGNAPTVAPTSGSDGPPEPISGPVSSEPAPGSATTPASQRPTWPDWQQQFAALGLSPADIAKVGNARLDDAQLAKVYEEIHVGIVASGGTPGLAKVSGSAWNPAWEGKFLALGLPQQFVDQLEAQAAANGSTDTHIASVYQQVQRHIGAPAPVDPKQQAQQVEQAKQAQRAQQAQLAQQPGWNPQVEAAFRSLGMPDEVIKVYAESGAPLRGLQAAHKHVVGRLDDFEKRGWKAKFEAAQVPPMQMWTALLGDEPATDKQLEGILAADKKSKETFGQKAGQLATSLVPGGRLAQYIMGHEVVSKDKIDRTSPLEIGLATLSGLAVVGAVAGARNLGAGWAARAGGYAQINGVRDTMSKLGITAAGSAAVEQTTTGAAQAWGWKQKLASAIPGTTLHKELIGMAHAEKAAGALNGGTAARILDAGVDGKLQLQTLAQQFDDIASGVTKVHGGGLAYLPALKGGAPMVGGMTKAGEDLITVSKALKLGNGNAQVVSMLEVGGAKLQASPEWLKTASPELVAGVKNLADASGLGRVMGGSAARTLAGDLGGAGMRSGKYIGALAKTTSPEWYGTLAKAAGGSVDDVAGAARSASGAAASGAGRSASSLAPAVTEGPLPDVTGHQAPNPNLDPSDVTRREGVLPGSAGAPGATPDPA